MTTGRQLRSFSLPKMQLEHFVLLVFIAFWRSVQVDTVSYCLTKNCTSLVVHTFWYAGGGFHGICPGASEGHFFPLGPPVPASLLPTGGGFFGPADVVADGGAGGARGGRSVLIEALSVVGGLSSPYEEPQAITPPSSAHAKARPHLIVAA